MKLALALLLLAAPCSVSRVWANDPAVASELAQAETLFGQNRALDALAVLERIPRSADEQVIRWAESRAENLHSFVLYELSRRLLDRDPEAALKWDQIAQMWLFYDGARCKQIPEGARRIKWVLNSMLQDVIRYQNDHRDTAVAGAKAALAWEAQHPSPASPAWVCDLGSATPPTDKSVVDASEWPRILAENRRTFDREIREKYGLPPDRFKAPAIVAGPENPSRYRIVDGDPLIMPYATGVHWTDNSHVLFVRTEPGHFESKDPMDQMLPSRRQTFALALWTPGGGIQVLAAPIWNYLCYSPLDGYILVTTSTQGGVRRGWEGSVGRLVPYSEPPPSRPEPYVDTTTCRRVNSSTTPQAARPGIELLPGHGFLSFPDARKAGVFQLEPPGGRAPIRLPIQGEAVLLSGFYRFKGAYFLRPISPWEPGDPDANKARREEAYQQTGCKTAWWLWPSGRTEEVCIPYIPGVSSGDVAAVPTARGLFVTSRRTETPTRAGLAGAYVMTPRGLVKIFSGVVDGNALAVSPDGCKVAMAFAPSALAWQEIGPGRRILRTVELCSPKR